MHSKTQSRSSQSSQAVRSISSVERFRRGGGRFCTFYGRLQSTFSPAAVRDNRVTTILRFHHFILDMLTAQLAVAASAGDPTIDGLVMNDTDAIEALFRENRIAF